MPIKRNSNTSREHGQGGEIHLVHSTASSLSGTGEECKQMGGVPLAPPHSSECEERVSLTELRARLEGVLDRKPHPNTIQKAIHRGLPCEPHPLIEGRRVFPWLQVLAWIETQRKKSTLSAPLRAALR